MSRNGTKGCDVAEQRHRVSVSPPQAYASVTAVVWAGYVGLVLLATWLLSFSSPLAVAASILAAAVVFYPLRLRVQRSVKRRFAPRVNR
jgi:hypothetical protein